MSNLQFIYSIQSDGGQTPGPLKPQAHRILKIDDAGASIMLNNTVHIIRGRDLYISPSDVAHGIMFGTDQNKLCQAWDTAVKKKAMSVLNEYAHFFSARDIPRKDVTPDPEPPGEKGAKNAPERTVEAPKIEAATSPAAAPAEAPAPAQAADTGYPRACKVPWSEVESFLPRFIASLFSSSDTQIYARAIFGGDYAESSNSWTIILEDVSAEDRATMKDLLTKYDRFHEVDLDNEWPEAEPLWFTSFPLTTAISNEILARELLPSLTPAFDYGIQLAIPNADGLVLISQGASV